MTLSTEQEYRPFADAYRDYGRTVIDTIVHTVPALGGDQWWQDLTDYALQNPGHSIIETNGRAPTTAFDHNGVAKWFLNMYTDEEHRLNRYLQPAESPRAYLTATPAAYSRALAAYIELRNTFLGHAGEEELSPALMVSAANLILWMVEKLHRDDLPDQPSQAAVLAQLRTRRDDLVRRIGEALPAEETDKESITQWALDHIQKRRESAPPKQPYTPRRREGSLPFEGWAVAQPLAAGPWDTFLPSDLVFPSELPGKTVPRTYAVPMATDPREGYLTEEETPEDDYLTHQEKVRTGQFRPGQSKDNVVMKGVYKTIGRTADALNLTTTIAAGLTGVNIGANGGAGQRMTYRQIVDGLIYDIRHKVDLQPLVIVLCIWLLSLTLGSLPVVGYTLYKFLTFVTILGNLVLSYRLYTRVRQAKACAAEHKRLPQGLGAGLYLYQSTAASFIGQGLLRFCFVLIPLVCVFPPLFYIMITAIPCILISLGL